MPVGQLDENTLNSQGLGKPTPKARRQAQVVQREDVGAIKEVEPPEPVGDGEIRMPDPNPGASVDSDEEPSVPQTRNTTEYFKSIFSPELREITKKILMNSDEGKLLLEEIGVHISESNTLPDNQLSPWEQECLQQIRSSLSQFQEQEELQVQVQVQVLLPLQPFVFSIKK